MVDLSFKKKQSINNFKEYTMAWDAAVARQHEHVWNGTECIILLPQKTS